MFRISLKGSSNWSISDSTCRYPRVSYYPNIQRFCWSHSPPAWPSWRFAPAAAGVWIKEDEALEQPICVTLFTLSRRAGARSQKSIPDGVVVVFATDRHRSVTSVVFTSDDDPVAIEKIVRRSWGLPNRCVPGMEIPFTSEQGTQGRKLQ
jgi:hypothetical protein